MATAPTADAADEAVVLELRAAELSRTDRCDEAIEVARQGRELAPESIRFAQVEAFCLAQVGRYEEAIPALERLRGLDPDAEGVDLRLGVSHYQLENFDAAREAFDAAAAEDPDNAEILFYQGLLALRESQHASAADMLERSVARDPDGIGAAGSYYAGLAWERARDDERAEQALEEAIAADPGSRWATQAEEALARIKQRHRRRRWASLTAGMEWDDNAVLRGSGVELPAEISNESDWRGVWRVEAGQELHRSPHWASGIVAGYQGYAYVELDEFNLHYPSVSLWVDRRLSEQSFVRLMPTFGYGWRDQDDYIQTYGVAGEFHHLFEQAGNSRLFVRFERLDLLFNVIDNPFTPRNEETLRNRDGNRWLLGFDHSYTLDAKTTLRGGFTHERYDARGREYSFLGYEPWIGVSRELLWKLTTHLRVDYQYRDYRHPSTYLDPGDFTLSDKERQEHDVGVEVVLERQVTDRIGASLRWRFRNNESNRDVYAYDRHRIGAFVTIAWSN